jgi:hypothetical protein
VPAVVANSVLINGWPAYTLLALSFSPIVAGMDMISLEGKTNFFEKRVAEYQKSGVMESLKEQGSKSLDFDADF